MDFKDENGAAVKNDTTKSANNTIAQNGAVKKETTTNAKAQNGNAKPESEKAKPEAPAQPQQELKPPAEVQPNKNELTLDAKLRLVSDLHRRSVQRLNLISRMRQLEAFEIALLQENDELEDNPYQGCKLIIRDDKNRDFVTTTPGLIRMVSQYIFIACNEKLTEIESTIIFPNA